MKAQCATITTHGIGVVPAPMVYHVPGWGHINTTSIRHQDMNPIPRLETLALILYPKHNSISYRVWLIRSSAELYMVLACKIKVQEGPCTGLLKIAVWSKKDGKTQQHMQPRMQQKRIKKWSLQIMAIILIFRLHRQLYL